MLSSIDWLAYDPEAILCVFVLPKSAEHDCIGALSSAMLESNASVLWNIHSVLAFQGYRLKMPFKASDQPRLLFKVYLS